MRPRAWQKGQLWKTRHGQLMLVTDVREDGVALIRMVKPYYTRAHTQKPIPQHWKLMHL